jgi:vacuolar protein sorting-associated protein 54
MIMLPVFSSYRDQLGSSFREADPKTEAGLKRYISLSDLS